jgi:hypothetical protein
MIPTVKKKKMKLLMSAVITPLLKCVPTILEEGLGSPKKRNSRLLHQHVLGQSDLSLTAQAVLCGSLYQPRGPKQRGPPSYYKEQMLGGPSWHRTSKLEKSQRLLVRPRD